MIEIKQQGEIVFEGQKVELAPKILSDFLLANLSELIEINQDVSIGDLMHLLYPIRDFITNYTCEDFGVVQAVFMGKSLENEQQLSTVVARREMIKSFDNELIIPFFASFSLEKDKTPKTYLRDVLVKIDTQIVFKNFEGKTIDKMIKRFTLLEFISFLFGDLYDFVTTGESFFSPS